MLHVASAWLQVRVAMERRGLLAVHKASTAVRLLMGGAMDRLFHSVGASFHLKWTTLCLAILVTQTVPVAGVALGTDTVGRLR